MGDVCAIAVRGENAIGEDVVAVGLDDGDGEGGVVGEKTKRLLKSLQIGETFLTVQPGRTKHSNKTGVFIKKNLYILLFVFAKNRIRAPPVRMDMAFVRRANFGSGFA